jgi:HAD superfamily hydrolase (TIGR01509 family)
MNTAVWQIAASCKAVVFDMDGLLIDSESLALEAMHAAGRDQGVDMPPALRREMIGVPADTCRDLVRRRYGSAVDLTRLFADAARRLEDHVRDGRLHAKPGVHALLDELDRLALPRAVATSSSRARAQHHLASVRLLERMHAVVTRDDVALGKPHPDLYLEAARRLRLPPSRCLAFEDSYNGVRAAVRAAMPVVMVPDLLPSTPEMQAAALCVFGTLEEVLPHFRARDAVDRGVA